jgi:hypothetical protein
MYRSGNQNVCVFLSFFSGTPSSLLATLAPFIEELGSRRNLESVPVHWCFPACALESRAGSQARLVPMLRGKLASGRDLLLLRGYSAVPHSLLLSGDVRRDLEWAVLNPWKSGISDIFAEIKPVVFPSCPDWQRESTREIYDSFKDPLLIELINGTTENRWYVLKRADGTVRRLVLYEYTSPAQKDKQWRRDLLRQAKKSTYPIALQICADDRGGLEDIAGLLFALEELRRSGIDFKNVTELKSSDSVDEAVWRNIPAPSVPSSLHQRMIFGYSRTEISASARRRRSKSGTTQ